MSKTDYESILGLGFFCFALPALTSLVFGPAELLQEAVALGAFLGITGTAYHLWDLSRSRDRDMYTFPLPLRTWIAFALTVVGFILYLIGFIWFAAGVLTLYLVLIASARTWATKQQRKAGPYA